MEDKYNLSRFLLAQERAYTIAFRELQDGRKRSHWMWYVFPQLKYLGRSDNSKFYGISGIDEASAYLAHPVLGQRLREVSLSILNLPTDNAAEVFGGIDSRKLKSSMTLFDMVSPNDVFSKVLEKFFAGKRDNNTTNILKTLSLADNQK